MTNLVPGGGAIRETLVSLQHNIPTFVTGLVASYTDMQVKLRQTHVKYIDLVGRAAYQNFKESIEHTEVSITSGGRGYRADARATGKFFGRDGGPRAFRGRLFENLKTGEQGFGYPDMSFADQSTDGAWRSLEFGASPGEIRMPQHIWLGMADSGKFVRRVAGPGQSRQSRVRKTGRFSSQSSGPRPVSPERGVVFQPISRVANLHPRQGIESKHFIRDAWDQVIPGLKRDYRTLFHEAFRK